MKLNLTKKSDNNENSIAKKVSKILALNEPEPEKEKNEMKLNLKKSENQKTEKPKKLQLNKTDSKMEIENRITLEKLDRIDKLTEKIFDLDSSFNTFLDNQNESIQVINSFNQKLDNLENLILNSIKNQKSILDGINKFHSILMKQEKPFYKETEKETEKPKTILRKKEKETEPIETDSIESIYDFFQSKFNGSFYGNDTEKPEKLEIFKALLENLEIDSIDSIEKSLKKFQSAIYKQNQKYIVARKSSGKFLESLIETVNQLQEKPLSYDNSKKEKPAIDLKWFSEKFNIDKGILIELINEIKEYGKLDKYSIESISNYLTDNNESISDNMIGKFINFLKPEIEKE